LIPSSKTPQFGKRNILAMANIGGLIAVNGIETQHSTLKPNIPQI